MLHVLSSINSGYVNDESIRRHLDLSISRVRFYIEELVKNGYVKAGESSDDYGYPSFRGCWLTNQGKVIVENSKELPIQEYWSLIDLNEEMSQILLAIKLDYTQDGNMQRYLGWPIEKVRHNIEELIDKQYIKARKCWDDAAFPGFMACQLTNKGEVAIEDLEDKPTQGAA